MHKLSHKIIVVLLTPILLFSTTSFTIEKHICGEMICSIDLKGVDFTNKDKNNTHPDGSCCLDEKSSCCTGDADCCIDDLIVVKGIKIKKEKKYKLQLKRYFHSILYSFLFKIYCVINEN